MNLKTFIAYQALRPDGSPIMGYQAATPDIVRESLSDGMAWQHYESQGYRVVKVEVREVQEKSQRELDLVERRE